MCASRSHPLRTILCDFNRPVRPPAAARRRGRRESARARGRAGSAAPPPLPPRPTRPGLRLARSRPGRGGGGGQRGRRLRTGSGWSGWRCRDAATRRARVPPGSVRSGTAAKAASAAVPCALYAHESRKRSQPAARRGHVAARSRGFSRGRARRCAPCGPRHRARARRALNGDGGACTGLDAQLVERGDERREEQAARRDARGARGAPEVLVLSARRARVGAPRAGGTGTSTCAQWRRRGAPRGPQSAASRAASPGARASPTSTLPTPPRPASPARVPGEARRARVTSRAPRARPPLSPPHSCGWSHRAVEAAEDRPVGARACCRAAARASGLPEPRLCLAPRGPRPAPPLAPDGAQRGRRRAAEAVAVEVERQREQQQALGKVRTMLRRRRDAVAREESGAPLFLRAGARGEALEHHLRPKTVRPKTGRQAALRRPAQRAQRICARRRRPARPARRGAPPIAGHAPLGRSRRGEGLGGR